MAFAKDSGIELSLIDEDNNDYHLPGKPLSGEQLMAYLNKGKVSGTAIWAQRINLFGRCLKGIKIQTLPLNLLFNKLN